MVTKEETQGKPSPSAVIQRVLPHPPASDKEEVGIHEGSRKSFPTFLSSPTPISWCVLPHENTGLQGPP